MRIYDGGMTEKYYQQYMEDMVVLVYIQIHAAIIGK